MLLFNRSTENQQNWLNSISKHLMLLFNRCLFWIPYLNSLFQNISCYCLTNVRAFFLGNATRFQNISCYCLTGILMLLRVLSSISKHLMLLFNCGKNSFGITVTNISKHLMLLFNTMDSSKRVIFIGFQNISCYCLTQSHLKPIVSFPLFQNISCYCLTTKPLQSAVPRCGFQNISCYCLTFCHQLPPACFLTISKHLMLLFNWILQ